jgi:hypothetical protein
LKDGFETLVGHTNKHLFKFLVDSMSLLVMQYKVSPIDLVWNLVDALPIKLWKANPNGSPKLRTNIPNPVPDCPTWGIDPSRSIEKQKFISVGLSKYMNFRKVGIAKSATYEMKMKPYVE